ncbi:hypothetical protein [Herbaspirillum sp. RV1423]|uniref:hypothetical protein n=1 Tax=Herbaspirillum sp. RV1423 TaxID=1443993 RepID=UPI000551F7E5|nr:hypothetical protein [Herbaspirillum sp. RV1423]
MADLRDFFEVYIAPTEVCGTDAAKLKDVVAKLSVVLTQVRTQRLGGRARTPDPGTHRDDGDREELSEQNGIPATDGVSSWPTMISLSEVRTLTQKTPSSPPSQ